MNFKLVVIFLLVLTITACTPRKPENFDYGHLEHGKYLNSFFNVEVTVPKGWNIRSQEEMDASSNKGKEIIAGEDKALEAQLSASEVNVANLFSARQYTQDTLVNFNPSILLVAENVSKSPLITSGKDYLEASKKLLERSQLKYEIDEKFSKVLIGGRTFYKMKTQIDVNGFTIKQNFYSTIMQGFTFNIIASYVTDEQNAVLLKCIKSTKFKNKNAGE